MNEWMNEWIYYYIIIILILGKYEWMNELLYYYILILGCKHHHGTQSQIRKQKTIKQINK